MDNKQIGYLLFVGHLAVAVSLPILYAFFPSWRLVLLAIFIPIFLLHIRTGSCPITRMERKLHGEDITIIDLILYPLGLARTRENRVKTQMFVSTVFLSWMLANR
jgi:hypothetical protein